MINDIVWTRWVLHVQVGGENNTAFSKFVDYFDQIAYAGWLRLTREVMSSDKPTWIAVWTGDLSRRLRFFIAVPDITACAIVKGHWLKQFIFVMQLSLINNMIMIVTMIVLISLIIATKRV